MKRFLVQFIALGVWLQLACVAGGGDVDVAGKGAAANDKEKETATQKLEFKASRYSFDDKGNFVGVGDVSVIGDGVSIVADKVTLNPNTGAFAAEGHPVRVVQKTLGSEYSWQGDKISGNVKDKVFTIGGRHEAAFSPWYVTARASRRTKAGTLTFEGAKISTCDHILSDNPTRRAFAPWCFRATSITYETTQMDSGKTREWVTLKHPLVQIFGIPVFYFPYLAFPREIENVRIKQGNKNDWGWWIQVSVKHHYVPPDDGVYWLGEYIVEHRHDRGEALGYRNDFRNDRLSGDLFLYWMKDREPLFDQVVGDVEYNHRFETRSMDRYRLSGFGTFSLSDDLTARGQINWFSDNDLYYEFFDDEYKLNPEPESFLDVSFLKSGYEASIIYQPQVNAFNSVVERLPEMRVDVLRQSLWGGLQYQSRNAFSLLRMNFRDYDLPRADGNPDNENYASARVDSAHVLYRPLTLGFLNVVPRAGVRMTWYERSSRRPVTDAELQEAINSDTRRGDDGVTTGTTPYDADGGARTRWLAEYGVEMNIKGVAEFDVQSDFFEVDGLRHEVVPYVNYVLIPEEGEGDREYLYFFDEVDRIDEVNLLRLGLFQTLKTHRGFGPDRRTEQLFYMDCYYDHFFDTDTDSSQAGDLGVEIGITPHTWFKAEFKSLHDAHDGTLNVFNSNMRFGRADRANVTVGYLFRNDYQQRNVYSFGSDLTRVYGTGVFPIAYDESETVRAGLEAPIGDKNRFVASHTYDLLLHETASRRVTWYRKVNCWSFSLGLKEDNQKRSVELGFYLTAFPKSKLLYSNHYEDVE